ncbi:Cof-type HAD-IIB family hydrolase [Candidatus Enterococcus murrayae]|uniref:HAD family hydrolase n=1 Tax=Candidatus Enterococcus murrayae TaxID=2815321 RepID=A0ABS3HMR3_9ENTE|nr:Cof-type HAD-IIB family hydrolase [Enterococcus sp. MJM16]MBO0454277.1 HAD family hydrolase [Enterococcus sp. MJM16]
MSIKMIAVDMDGTFLNDQKEYNRERFEKLFQQLKENSIRFVVASGNQYDQLKSFFPENHTEMSFISENGANIVVEGNDYYNAQLAMDQVLETLKGIHALEPTAIVICGKRSAYVSETMPDDVFESVRFYYPSIKKLERLEDIAEENDEVFKFALSFPNVGIDAKLAALEEILAGEMIPVSSGHGDIDLIIPGVHKAYGLEKLSKEWGIDPSEIAAFGDSGNDVEMLSYVGSSFAMENAQERVKQVANGLIGSNNQESVLDTIEILLNS